MPDPMPAPDPQAQADELPAQLPYPVSINVRNSDLGIDEHAKATRLSEYQIVAVLRTKVNPGTVFFTAIDMKAFNATARGLIRVIDQRPLDDGIGIETLCEFIELSDDAKTKIKRLLGNGAGVPPPMPVASRNFVTDQLGVQPVYQRGRGANADFQVTTGERSYFEPAPLRQQAKPTGTTKFWGSLGVTAYVIAFLVIVAFFPAGRAVELMVWGKIAWSAERMWYWANHVGDVKLYNNT